MKTKVFVVEDIKVSSIGDRILIEQGDQGVSIGEGSQVQDLLDALLTVNYGIQRAKTRNKIRKQNEGN